MLCVSLVACDDDDDDLTTPPESSTLIDFVDAEGALTTLAQALETTGLRDTLGGEGPYTLFAPENAAFEELTVDELLQDDSLLADVIPYHMVSGALFPEDFSDGQTIETLQGDELTVSIDNDTIRLDGATVLAAVEAENGTAYVVDEVLLGNRTAYERLSLTEATQTATQLVDSAGLTAALDEPDATYTVFAPTNDAFDDVETDTLEQDELAAFLQYHVVGDAVLTSSEIEDSLTTATLQGEDVTLTRQNNTVFVNDAGVVDADLPASNGIVHLIDAVLTPPSQQDTAATEAEALGTSGY